MQFRRPSSLISTAGLLPSAKDFSSEQILAASQQTSAIEEEEEEEQGGSKTSTAPSVVRQTVFRARLSIPSSLTPDTLTSLVNTASINSDKTTSEEPAPPVSTTNLSISKKSSFIPLSRPRSKIQSSADLPSSDSVELEEDAKALQKSNGTNLSPQPDESSELQLKRKASEKTQPTRTKKLKLTSEDDEDSSSESHSDEEDDMPEDKAEDDEKNSSEDDVEEDEYSEDEVMIETGPNSDQNMDEEEEEDEVEIFDIQEPTNIRRSARLRLTALPTIPFRPMSRGPLIRRHTPKAPRSTKRSKERNADDDSVKDQTKPEAKKSQQRASRKQKSLKNHETVDKETKPGASLLENIGSCSFVKYHRNPTLESPLVLQLNDSGLYDEKGRILVGPGDMPKMGRGHGPFLIENSDKVAINTEQFTMADLCSRDFSIGDADEEFFKYEAAKLERRRKKEKLLQRKKEARGQGLTLREIEMIKDGMDPKGQDGDSKGADFDNLIDSVKTQPAAPQLTMIDGKFVIESTEVDRHQLAESAFNGPDGDTRVREVVNKYDEFRNSASYGKHSRTENWTANETDLFYEALSTWGTDFTAISGLFPGRTRRHIRNKFKYEERVNLTKLELALVRKIPCELQSYSVISGKDILPLDAVEEELKDIDRQYQQQIAVELENRAKARADDNEKAILADKEAFGTSYQDVRTYRKSKAQLRKELKANEVVLGSIDDV